MRLNLPYASTLEHAAQFAEMMVLAAKEISGAALDFTPASLEGVDQILDQMHQAGEKSDMIAETLFGFGCYVGEVFVRHHNGRWRVTDKTSMKGLAGFPMVVELANNVVCNPIGKVFKRIENGAEDNLPHFYHVFTSESDNPTHPPQVQDKPGFWRRLFRLS